MFALLIAICSERETLTFSRVKVNWTHCQEMHENGFLVGLRGGTGKLRELFVCAQKFT